MKEKFRQFMIGRYGTDGLNQFLSMASIVLLLLDNPLFRLIGVPMDQIVTYLAALFTVWSCVDYIIKNRNLVSTK